MGIDVDDRELILFKTLKTEDDFVDMYYLNKDIELNEIFLQEEEVESIYWMSREEIENKINNKEFLLSHIEFYNYLLEYLNVR